MRLTVRHWTVRTLTGCGLGMMLAAGSCTTMTGSSARECLMFDPITWSEGDTPETIIQVKEHNAVWVGRCK